MEKKNDETIWDKIAKETAMTRECALRGRKLFRQLPELPPEELVNIFKAICQAGEEFDPHCRYRERIVKSIKEDRYLLEFLNIKLPVKIAALIEKRIMPCIASGNANEPERV